MRIRSVSSDRLYTDKSMFCMVCSRMAEWKINAVIVYILLAAIETKGTFP